MHSSIQKVLSPRKNTRLPKVPVTTGDWYFWDC
uniref:Uncharacterized protein n=1 Tax=Arundo donax TaxID=35708 RepID=A0A0A9AXF3_ARUDO